ncbi:hypothetical protein H6776_02915 [Candidatus Nomurabacteria bacterium]|nr:hypothetical protein [Candidatus Nomurabacteria bacterium]
MEKIPNHSSNTTPDTLIQEKKEKLKKLLDVLTHPDFENKRNQKIRELNERIADLFEQAKEVSRNKMSEGVTSAEREQLKKEMIDILDEQAMLEHQRNYWQSLSTNTDENIDKALDQLADLQSPEEKAKNLARYS